MADVLQHELGPTGRMSISAAPMPSARINACALSKVWRARAEARQRVAQDVLARPGRAGRRRARPRAPPASNRDRPRCRCTTRLSPGGQQTLAQRLDLDVVDLGTTLVAPRRVGRYVGKALDPPLQRNLAGRNVEFEFDAAVVAQLAGVCLDAVAETRPAHALLAQVIEVEVGRDEAALERKALRFDEALAVLVDQRVAVPGDIGRRFAGARRRVQIRRQRTSPTATRRAGAGNRPCRP